MKLAWDNTQCDNRRMHVTFLYDTYTFLFRRAISVFTCVPVHRSHMYSYVLLYTLTHIAWIASQVMPSSIMFAIVVVILNWWSFRYLTNISRWQKKKCSMLRIYLFVFVMWHRFLWHVKKKPTVQRCQHRMSTKQLAMWSRRWHFQRKRRLWIKWNRFYIRDASKIRPDRIHSKITSSQVVTIAMKSVKIPDVAIFIAIEIHRYWIFSDICRSYRAMRQHRPITLLPICLIAE